MSLQEKFIIAMIIFYPASKDSCSSHNSKFIDFISKDLKVFYTAALGIFKSKTPIFLLRQNTDRLLKYFKKMKLYF